MIKKAIRKKEKEKINERKQKQNEQRDLCPTYIHDKWKKEEGAAGLLV